MAMQGPFVSDYVIVTGNRFLVRSGNPVTRNFRLPLSAVLDAGSEQPVVCYSMERNSGSPELEVYVVRGARTESVFKWKPGHQLRMLVTVMEPITGELLTTGSGSNTLLFSVSGGGSMLVKNVIIMFQRSAEPLPR